MNDRSFSLIALQERKIVMFGLNVRMTGGMDKY